jgi:uncharacterized protein YciI
VNYFLLSYELVDDYITRRAPLRDLHLRLAREAQARGEIILAGAFTNPPDGAALVFHAKDQSVAEDFARNDPYVVNGLVKHWKVRRWNVVVADQPISPGTT